MATLTNRFIHFHAIELIAFKSCSCSSGSDIRGGKAIFFCFLIVLIFPLFHFCCPVDSGHHPYDRGWPRVGFDHLGAGLFCTTALSRKVKVFSFLIPIGQGFLTIPPFVMDCSTVHDGQSRTPGFPLTARLVCFQHLNHCVI